MPEHLNISRLETIGLADYHCHCDYSVDAEGTIDEYCEAAIQRGLAELCFTTHYEDKPNSSSPDAQIRIDGKIMPTSPDLLQRYVDDVLRAHDTYFPQGLSVKLGVEIGWWDGCEESTLALKQRFPFDYVLCGIHNVGEVCICSPNYEKHLSKLTLDQLVQGFFEHATRAAKTGLFDTIAHLDYYRRYGLGVYGDDIKEAHEPYIRDFLEVLKNAGVGLEVNTAAQRHGIDDFYPSMKIVNAAVRAGVDLYRTGSDAHRPQDVGFDFDGARALIPNPIVVCEE